MMEQVSLCAVWPMENWLGTSLNQIRGWTAVRESYSRALEKEPLPLTCGSVFFVVWPLRRRPLCPDGHLVPDLALDEHGAVRNGERDEHVLHPLLQLQILGGRNWN